MLGKYVGKVCWNKSLHTFRALGHCSLLSCLLSFPPHYVPEDVTVTQKLCNKWAKFLLFALKKCSCIKSLQSPPRKLWPQQEGSLRKGTKFSLDCVFSEDLFCALWTWTEGFLTDVRDFTGRNCQISMRKAFLVLLVNCFLVSLVNCIHAREFCCK